MLHVRFESHQQVTSAITYVSAARVGTSSVTAARQHAVQLSRPAPFRFTSTRCERIHTTELPSRHDSLSARARAQLLGPPFPTLWLINENMLVCGVYEATTASWFSAGRTQIFQFGHEHTSLAVVSFSCFSTPVDVCMSQ